jgi:hypothetical protein
LNAVSGYNWSTKQGMKICTFIAFAIINKFVLFLSV